MTIHDWLKRPDLNTISDQELTRQLSPFFPFTRPAGSELKLSDIVDPNTGGNALFMKMIEEHKNKPKLRL